MYEQEYKFADNDKIYFVSFAITNWIDLFIANEMAHQKLDYIHYNPVESGFVTRVEEWKYISALDYYEGKGLLEIIKLDTLIV